MFIYFFIGSFLSVFLLITDFKKDKMTESLLFILSFFILFLISGFRTYEVGSYSLSYVQLYESFSYGGVFEPDIFKFFTGRIEYGFLLVNKLLYSISGSYVLLFSTFSFITLLIVFFVIKKLSPNIFLSLIIFFGYRLYTFSMSSLRASMSISICILAFYFFVKERKKLSFFTIILASSFHLSAMSFFVRLY